MAAARHVARTSVRTNIRPIPFKVPGAVLLDLRPPSTGEIDASKG
jgi:hypothetical protein